MNANALIPQVLAIGIITTMALIALAGLSYVAGYALSDVPDQRAYASDATCTSQSLALPAGVQRDDASHCTVQRAVVIAKGTREHGRGPATAYATLRLQNGSGSEAEFASEHALDRIAIGTPVAVRRLDHKTLAVAIAGHAIDTLELPPHRIANDVAGSIVNLFLLGWAGFATLVYRAKPRPAGPAKT